MIEQFGYNTGKELGYSMLKGINILTIYVSTVAVVIEEITGMEILLFFGFIGVFVVDWITGILAAKKRKEKIESRKLQKIFIKLGLYTTLLGIIHFFSHEIGNIGYTNLYNSVYYFGLNVIIISQLKSIVENMQDILGSDKILNTIISELFKRFKKIN